MLTASSERWLTGGWMLVVLAEPKEILDVILVPGWPYRALFTRGDPLIRTLRSHRCRVRPLARALGAREGVLRPLRHGVRRLRTPEAAAG